MMEIEASNNFEQTDTTMKGETEEMYEKTYGGASAHGHFMEIHLLTLFKLQGDKQLEEFYLAGNFRRAGAFDDIVFRYKDDTDRQNVIFLQAKSKATNTNKVGLEIFETGGMFDLQKHFKAYLKIQDEWHKPTNVGPIFRGNAKNTNCHFVMYTNAIRNENMIQHVNEMDKNPLSIVLGQASGDACKLKVETATTLFREILNSDEIKQVITLLKNLSNTGCKNMQRDEIFNMYHAFLTQTVLVKNGSYWKFREEFLAGGFENETLTNFREATIKWYADTRLGVNKEITSNAIPEHMSTWEVQLPDWMENLKPIKTALCDKFIATASRCITGNICTIKNIRKDVMSKVATLAGNVFMFDEKNAMFKFNEQVIDDESKKLMEYMRSKLKVPNLNFDFQVEKFPRLSLGFTKINYKMQEFINKLVILTGQPSEDDLKDIITHVISINVSDEEAKIRCLQMKDKITEWWKHPHAVKYLKKDDKLFQGILSGTKFHLKSPLQSFTGRTAELQKLLQALQNKDCKNKEILQLASISGLGGIGKSEMARQYANKYGDSYDGNIIWIDAETHNTITDSFRKLCKDCLNIPTQNADKEEMEISTIVQIVYRSFRHRKCLFIFDNAVQFKNDRNGNNAIKPFLPETQQGTDHHFIITSRNQNWPSDINIKLDVFKDGEAEQLVKCSLGIQEGQHITDVKALIQQLGNFPLALQQALAFIRQMDKNYRKAIGKSFTISDYLTMYALQSKDLLDFVFPSDCNDTYTKTTFMTWNITLAAIENAKLGKEAREIVNIIAYLNPNNIPITFFTEVVDSSHGKLIQAFNLIEEEYSVITLHDGKANIHRLVQKVTRIILQVSKQQKFVLQKALKLIGNHTDNKLIIQGVSLWNYINQDDDLVKEFHTIPAKIIEALNETVRYEQALRFGNTSLKSLTRVIGPDHPFMLNAQHNVAKALSGQGKYEEAICCYREVLEKQIKILGPGNPSTLTTKHNYAQTLSDLGKYEEALYFYGQVLDKEITILGPENLSVLTTQHNVAYILSNQGKYDEALCSYKKVLEKQINILGPEHPATLITQHNIAQTLSNQGKYDEALCSYKKVIEKQTKILGPEHPSTLITQNNVAQTLSDQGKHEEALCSYKEVLEKRIKILGPEHPSTLTTQHNVAQTLSNLDKYEEALSYYKEVLQKRMKIFGPEHPSTLTDKYNVAQTLSDQEMHEEALCCYKEVLEKRIKILGPEHPSTLITQHNIAQTLSNQGKYDEALCSYEKVLEVLVKILGKENPYTLAIQHDVAQTLSDQGKYKEALFHYKKVLKKQIKILGPEHPFTLTTQHNVAKTLSNQGKHEEALCSYTKLLEIQITALGPDNPSTLTTKHNYAQTLSNLGKYEKAICFYREVLEKETSLLGPENPSVLITEHNVAYTMSKQGKYDEALCSYKNVLEKQIKILGPEHPSTLITEHNVAQTLSTQGKHEEALSCYKEVLEKRIKILGPNHPSTLTTQHNFAKALSNHGKYDEAVCAYGEVLEKDFKIFGPDNQPTLGTQRHSAQLVRRQRNKRQKCLII